MAQRSVALRLGDMIEAAERVRTVMGDLALDAFEADWQCHWLLQRGIEIISEASRHLPSGRKAWHAHTPWTKVAGIGNVLRHGYETIEASILWKLVREGLPALKEACRAEQEKADDGAHSFLVAVPSIRVYCNQSA